MKKTVVVIGLGQFGMSIVNELIKEGVTVVAIDTSKEQVEKVASLTPTAFIADCTDEKAMKELELQKADHAILAFGDNIPATMLSTAILKEMGVEHIIVRVDNEFYVPIIKKLGADDIVSPQKLAGLSIAHRLLNASFVDYYSLDDNFSVVKILIGEDFSQQTLAELNLRNEFDINLILITRNKKTFAPKGSDSLQAGDIAFVVGKAKAIQKFMNHVEK